MITRPKIACRRASHLLARATQHRGLSETAKSDAQSAHLAFFWEIERFRYLNFAKNFSFLSILFLPSFWSGAGRQLPIGNCLRLTPSSTRVSSWVGIACLAPIPPPADVSCPIFRTPPYLADIDATHFSSLPISSKAPPPPAPPPSEPSGRLFPPSPTWYEAHCGQFFASGDDSLF